MAISPRRPASTASAPQSCDASPACLPGALAQCPDFLLSSVAMTVTELLEDMLAPLGLRLRHYRLMRVLLYGGPLPQAAIGASMSIDRTTVVAIVDHLERLRLAKRKRCTDRRAYTVVLTQKGEKLALEASKRATELEAKMFAPLAPAERDELRRLSTQLLSAPGPIAEAIVRGGGDA